MVLTLKFTLVNDKKDPREVEPLGLARNSQVNLHL